MKKPIHKRWWFWVIIVFLGLGLIGSFSNEDTVKKEDYQKLEAKVKLKNNEIAELKDHLTDSKTNIDKLKDEKEAIQDKLSVYEEKETKIAKKEAEKLLNSAEKTLNATDLDKAKDFINKNEFLSVDSFSSQLDSIQEKIDKKVADKKQKDEKAKKEAAVKKKAEQEAEAKRKAAENKPPTIKKDDGDKKIAEKAPEPKQAPKTNPQPKQTEPVPKSNETVTTVFVAPQSGKKYHYSSDCRGLSRANAVKTMSKNEAIASGYSLCGFED